MVPQNQARPQPQNQQSGYPSFANISPSHLDSSAFLLDSPQVAKQMAALTAANQARIAQNSRITGSPLPPSNGTSSGSYLGVNNSHSFPSTSHDLLTNSANGHANLGMLNTYSLPQAPNSTNSASFLDATMSQPNTARNLSLKQRQQSFLQGLHSLMSKRHPLPPQLTGIPHSGYDPTNSPWSIIEPSKEVGSFVLAGKDVSLFKLWGIVHSNGGGPSVTAANGWGSIAQQFDLPEEFPTLQANNSTSVALMLSQYYMAILHPFEEVYMKNVNDQQKKAQMAQRSGSMPGQQFPTQSGIGLAGGMPNMQQPGMRPMNSNGMMAQSIPSANGLNPYPPIQLRPNASQNPHSAADSHSPIVSTEMDPLAHTMDSNLLDQDMQGIKRKHDQDDVDTKRARQKTEPPENGSMLMAMNGDGSIPVVRQDSQTHLISDAQSRSRKQATRRKIEYVPLKREVDTYGGRDLQAVDHEWHSIVPRRPLRDIHDWGLVDIECLCMSIRSRLSIELSYALTTLTVLSTMKGATPGSGFPIYNCPDLLDDVLDLMEEYAFVGPEASPGPEFAEGSSKIYTNRELVSLVQDMEGNPFAPLRLHQGSKDPKLGPQQRPGNVVIAIVNILRNLAMIQDNAEFIANHPRLVDMLLRLCCVEQVDGRSPAPVSKNLSVSDLVLIRRETMYFFMGIAGLINFARTSSSPTTLRTTRRAFELVASYLVDPTESVPPLASVQIAGVPPSANRRPPPLADMALDVFTHLSQADANRQVITKAVPSTMLWLLLESLVHRLPLIDADFILMQREYWLGYVEKVVMGIYSLVFLAPFELKQRIKGDRRLGFKHVMFRMAQRVLNMPNDGRTGFAVSARRAVESMKLLDSAEDVTDTSESTVPSLSFGMGFADGGDSGMEKGTGMLGGNRGIGWEMLMLRDVFQDDVLFNELDSLVRVEC